MPKKNTHTIVTSKFKSRNEAERKAAFTRQMVLVINRTEQTKHLKIIEDTIR